MTDRPAAMGATLTIDSAVPRVPSIWRRIRRDVVILAAGNVGIVAAQLCFRGLLVAALVPADYGRLSLILGIYNTVWILGASGLPNTVARHLAISPANDRAIIRTAIRAGAGPIVAAAAIVAVVAAVVLNSPVAGLFGALGVVSLVYSLLAMGILRGRRRMGLAALIMPLTGACEVGPLAIVWLTGIGVDPLSAFGCFCLGNVLGLLAGVSLVRWTSPAKSEERQRGRVVRERAPTTRQLLGFSVWLGAATAGVAILPLVMRGAVALQSYTVVAVVDVALILFTIPQRIGTVIVSAVVPHATEAMDREDVQITVSLRESLLIALPFVAMSLLVAFTPVVRLLFDAAGRPVYAHSARYLALALLAAPARILACVGEGLLIARGEGRFLAVVALSVTIVVSGVIFAIAAAGGVLAAFAVFVVAYWATYLLSRARIDRPVRRRRLDVG